MTPGSYGSNDMASGAFAITPSDSTDLVQPAYGIYIGGDGNLKVMMIGDTVAVTFTGLVAGSFLPIAVKRVYSTSTTATAILGLK